jgi:hypothetical protein
MAPAEHGHVPFEAPLLGSGASHCVRARQKRKTLGMADRGASTVLGLSDRMGPTKSKQRA